MTTTTRTIALALAALLTTESLALAAVDAKGAAYVGGTIAAFDGRKDPVEGTLLTNDTTQLVFTAAGHRVEIPWTAITDVEYGQKAGRRVGAAVGTAVLLGPIGLVTLFSKKRKHYLTVSYGTDVAVFELGKDIVRTTLPIVEARSGQTITYQDDEAKKHAK